MRSSLFQINGVEKKPLLLPEAEGPVIQKQEKVYVPVKDHPEVSRELLQSKRREEIMEESKREI